MPVLRATYSCLISTKHYLLVFENVVLLQFISLVDEFKMFIKIKYICSKTNFNVIVHNTTVITAPH